MISCYNKEKKERKYSNKSLYKVFKDIQRTNRLDAHMSQKSSLKIAVVYSISPIFLKNGPRPQG